MSNNNSIKIGFFSALIGTFKGTEIFFQLKDQKMWRTILHMFFMLIICSIAVNSIQNYSGVSPLKKTCELLHTVFGGAIFDYENSQILPQKSPEKSRYIILAEQGLLSYVASSDSQIMPKDSSFKAFNYIIFWFPNKFFIINKANNDHFVGLSLGINMMFNIENYNYSELEEKLSSMTKKETYIKPLDDDCEKISIQQLAFQYRVTQMFAFVIGGILQNLIFTSLFIGFFLFTNKGRLKKLKFKSLMNCALYAGLPAMFVASAFPALDLPLLSFGSAYMLGVAFYLMFIIRKIELSEISNG